MGLDMYLHAEKYVSGWNHNPDPAYPAICALVGAESSSDSPSLTVTVTAFYWRKANAIHSWFVENFQDGVDECQQAYVGRSGVEQLVKICSEILESRNPDLLMPKSGFFFGSTDVDEWYWRDIERTRDGLIEVLEQYGDDWSFTYQSSW